jgi:hypothetical protein
MVLLNKKRQLMTIKNYKKKYKDGMIYFRSICKYEINGIKKQINVDAYYPFNELQFKNEISKQYKNK